MTSDLMLAIKTIIIVSPNWRKVLKLFRQTEVRCAAIDSASLADRVVTLVLDDAIAAIQTSR